MNEIIVIDPDCLELDLNHGRINKLQNLEPLTSVERLYFRWNLITKIENLDHLVTLKELELYDNQITKIENLGNLVNLEILDLSFNRIREIEGLENLINLKKLFLSSNKISKIENLNHLVNLTLLELGDNKLRVSKIFIKFLVMHFNVFLRKLKILMDSLTWNIYIWAKIKLPKSKILMHSPT